MPDCSQLAGHISYLIAFLERKEISDATNRMMSLPLQNHRAQTNLPYINRGGNSLTNLLFGLPSILEQVILGIFIHAYLTGNEHARPIIANIYKVLSMMSGTVLCVLCVNQFNSQNNFMK